MAYGDLMEAQEGEGAAVPTLPENPLNVIAWMHQHSAIFSLPGMYTKSRRAGGVAYTYDADNLLQALRDVYDESLLGDTGRVGGADFRAGNGGTGGTMAADKQPVLARGGGRAAIVRSLSAAASGAGSATGGPLLAAQANGGQAGGERGVMHHVAGSESANSAEHLALDTFE